MTRLLERQERGQLYGKLKLACFAPNMMCRYIGEEGEEVKYSYKELSEASQKAATVVESLGLQKAVCILPKVRAPSSPQPFKASRRCQNGG